MQLIIPGSGCESEQEAAKALGYTQVSWDDVSGKEKQPSHTDKSWLQMTAQEKAALTVLGYIAKTWDDVSGKETQPASASKTWDKLSVCGENLFAFSRRTGISVAVALCLVFIYGARRYNDDGDNKGDNTRRNFFWRYWCVCWLTPSFF